MGRHQHPGIYVAGDGAGIGGAHAASIRGPSRGAAIANAHGRLAATSAIASPARFARASRRHCAAAAFLDALYRPDAAFRIPQATRSPAAARRCARRDRARGARRMHGPNQAKATRDAAWDRARAVTAR
jgi:hypothetical protein